MLDKFLHIELGETRLESAQHCFVALGGDICGTLHERKFRRRFRGAHDRKQLRLVIDA